MDFWQNGFRQNLFLLQLDPGRMDLGRITVLLQLYSGRMDSGRINFLWQLDSGRIYSGRIDLGRITV
jgi:hypothetical protein